MKRYDQFSQIVTAEDGTQYASGLPFMDFLYSGRIVYHKVQQSEIGRLDLIAYKYFQDPSYWYPIALFNSLFDVVCLEQGTELAIPIDLLSQSEFIPFTYPNEVS